MDDTNSVHYAEPPVTLSFAGKERRVGVEIELTGPDVEQLVDHVTRVFGGDRRFYSEFEWRVETSALGSFRIELDSDLLKKIGRQEESSGEWIDHLASLALGSLSKGLVPCEIVSPPIPLKRLHQLDALVVNLRADGAKGTHDSIWNAFGLHLNPEVPSLQADSILAYLRAFLCLYDWLKEVEHVDISRRLSPYIRPFGADYVRLVVNPDYQPDMAQLIDDYLTYNPTRNRALDFLPLFTFIDEPRVRAVVQSTLVKARPTFHYRLPNCDIDNPAWGIHLAWNRWCQVEELAAYSDRLRDVCLAYGYHLDSLTPDFLNPWSEQVKQWLTDPSLA